MYSFATYKCGLLSQRQLSKPRLGDCAYECQNGFHPQEPDVSEQLRKARQKSQAALLRQGTAGDAAEAGSFIGTPQGVMLS